MKIFPHNSSKHHWFLFCLIDQNPSKIRNVESKKNEIKLWCNNQILNKQFYIIWVLKLFFWKLFIESITQNCIIFISLHCEKKLIPQGWNFPEVCPRLNHSLKTSFIRIGRSPWFSSMNHSWNEKKIIWKFYLIWYQAFLSIK